MEELKYKIAPQAWTIDDKKPFADNGEYYPKYSAVYFTNDKDPPCEPGVRIYLDCHKMIRDKIVFRDGLHPVKVKSKPDLDTYMVFSVTAIDLDPENRTTWTPRVFAELGDRLFLSTLLAGPCKSAGHRAGFEMRL